MKQLRMKQMVGAIALALSCGVASADVVYQFTFVSSPTIGVPPLGTVTLHQDGANQVDVTVALDPFGQTRFVDTGGPHDAFAFNIAASLGAYTVTDVDPAWMAAIAPANDTPYGVYTDGISCAACGPGASNSIPFGLGPIHFSVNGIGIDYADFVANAAGFLFAADVIGPNGGTGAIAVGTTPTNRVPEPNSLALAGMGIGMVGMFTRRKKRVS